MSFFALLFKKSTQQQHKKDNNSNRNINSTGYVPSETGYNFVIVISNREDVFQMVSVYFTPSLQDKAISDNGLGCDMVDRFIFDINSCSLRSN